MWRVGAVGLGGGEPGVGGNLELRGPGVAPSNVGGGCHGC
jgi:hypothetical protein